MKGFDFNDDKYYETLSYIKNRFSDELAHKVANIIMFLFEQNCLVHLHYAPISSNYSFSELIEGLELNMESIRTFSGFKYLTRSEVTLLKSLCSKLEKEGNGTPYPILRTLSDYLPSNPNDPIEVASEGGAKEDILEKIANKIENK